jgi:actin-like ATPase involved in cell morphogenesis/intein/homing endonuclease
MLKLEQHWRKCNLETYYVGIDLGTSRTSIATSTGVRLTTDTVVGFAKDVIAQKRFGANYLMGKTAIDNRLALKMVWPLADGVLQISEENLKATRLIIQNILNVAIPDKKPDDKIFASIGVPAKASMENKTDLLTLSKGILDKLLIVSEPFAVAYGMDRFDEVMIVDIGAGCLAGDTKISLLDGTEVPIKELEGDKGFYVYSYDLNRGEIVPGRVASCKKTKLNTELVQVTLDNDEKIKCTPDHPFLTRFGKYVEAQNLKPGDSLMPLYRSEDKYEKLLQPGKDWEPTHRMVYRWKYGVDLYHAGKWIAHHKDYNCKNNDPSNLLGVTWTEHREYHAKYGFKVLQDKMWNPDNELYDDFEDARQRHKKSSSKTMKDVMKKMWNPEHPEYGNYEDSRQLIYKARKKQVVDGKCAFTTDEFKEAQSIRTTERNVKLAVEGKHPIQLLVKSGEWPEICRNRKEPEFERIDATCPYCAKEFKNVVKNSFNSHKNHCSGAFRTFTKDEQEKAMEVRRKIGFYYCEYCEQDFECSNASFSTHRQHCKEKAEGVHRKIYKFTKKDIEKGQKARMKLVPCPVCGEEYKKAGLGRHIKACEQKLQRYANHKVKSVTFLEEKEDVYDLTIDSHHNFALSSGVFVHNTVDLVRIHGTMPEDEDQITLTTAGNYLDSVIEKAILGKHPKVQLTKQIIKRIKEKYGYVTASEPVKIRLTEKGKPADYDITGLLQECCFKLTDPICEAVQKLVGEFDPEFQEKLRNNVIIAGGGSRLRGIDRAVEKGLEEYGGGDAFTVQDAEFAGAEGSLKMALEMPEEYWEQL